MINKSSKLRKLENNRYSLFTDDLEHCIICHCTGVDMNEVFMGRNRLNSIKYGMCIPLCTFHHQQYHLDRGMQLYWMELGRKKFIENYSAELWLKTFRYIKRVV